MTAPMSVEEVLAVMDTLQWGFNHRRCPLCAGWNCSPYGETDHAHTKDCPFPAARAAVEQMAAELKAESARLDYIERTFSGMTNRERYLPVQMIWGTGANGRTLREACDKYMKRDAARHRQEQMGEGERGSD